MHEPNARVTSLTRASQTRELESSGARSGGLSRRRSWDSPYKGHGLAGTRVKFSVWDQSYGAIVNLGLTALILELVVLETRRRACVVGS